VSRGSQREKTVGTPANFVAVFRPTVFRKAFSSTIIALSIAAALCGCGRPMDRADLVLLNGGEPQTLDPAAMTGQLDARIAYALFEGLTSFDQTGTPKPGVAESWEISKDGLHYTFHLRHNAKWSNGDILTSADFLNSWRRTLLPATGSEYASQFYYIHNAKDFNEGKLTDFSQVGVRAPDPWTVEVTLDNPTPFFLDLCAFATLLPVHVPSIEACQKRGESWTKPGKLIGNGAFTLKEWRLFDRIRLVKSPTYWNAANVQMRSIDVLPTDNRNTAFNFYATGVADLMLDKNLTPTAFLDDLKKRPDYHPAPFLGNYFIRFNVTKKPFNDPRVRMAFSLAIDKKIITEKITRAGEQPADSLTPPGTANYDPPPGLTYDPKRARELLAAAGYPNGENFPIVYYLTTGNTGGVDGDIGVELQGMLAKELGVKIQLQRQEWAVYLNSLSRLDYDFCRSSWVGDYNDANTFLSCFVTDDGNNRTGWSDHQFDELIAAAGREADLHHRAEIFRKAEHMLVSEAVPICPLYYYVGIQLYDGSRLGGIQANVIDEHPLKSLFWKTAPR